MSTRLLSAAARLRKLRAMNAPEIVHRLRYAALIAVERRQHASGRLAPADRLAKALRSDLGGGGWEQRLLNARAGQRHRFFASVRAAEEMRSLFAEVSEACDNTLWVAERANVASPTAAPTSPIPTGVGRSR